MDYPAFATFGVERDLDEYTTVFEQIVTISMGSASKRGIKNIDDVLKWNFGSSTFLDKKIQIDTFDAIVMKHKDEAGVIAEDYLVFLKAYDRLYTFWMIDPLYEERIFKSFKVVK